MLSLCCKVVLPSHCYIPSKHQSNLSAPYKIRTRQQLHKYVHLSYSTFENNMNDMYTNTAKSHTGYGWYNLPDRVTLSAFKTKHIYIHINNPKSSPHSLSNWRPASRPPLRATAAAAVRHTKSMGIFQRSVTVHCPGKSDFFLQGPGERRASQITPYQFIGSGWSQFGDLLHCLLCNEAGRRTGSGKSTDRFSDQCIDPPVSQGYRTEENTALLTLKSFSFRLNKGFTFTQY